MTTQNISKIIFTGPESTGKTVAATKYAKDTSLPLVVEYARAYLEKKGGSYRLSDLYTILEEQYKLEEIAQAKSDLIVCDTDWLTIHIWAKDKYNKEIRPPFDIADRYYILCPPDIPWEADPLREHPEDRERLYELYKGAILRYDLSFEILKRV